MRINTRINKNNNIILKEFRIITLKRVWFVEFPTTGGF